MPNPFLPGHHLEDWSVRICEVCEHRLSQRMGSTVYYSFESIAMPIAGSLLPCEERVTVQKPTIFLPAMEIESTLQDIAIQHTF